MDAEREKKTKKSNMLRCCCATSGGKVHQQCNKTLPTLHSLLTPAPESDHEKDYASNK